MEVKTVRVLVLHEGDWLVAQCLEYDIAAQARSIENLAREFTKVFVEHLIWAQERNEEPFVDVGPAPERYQNRWQDVRKFADKVPLSLPPDEAFDKLPCGRREVLERAFAELGMV